MNLLSNRLKTTSTLDCIRIQKKCVVPDDQRKKQQILRVLKITNIRLFIRELSINLNR